MELLQLAVVKECIALKSIISFFKHYMHFTSWSSNLCISCHSYGPMCHLVEKVNLKRYCQPELGGFTVENKKEKKY